mmetsp:Transcript_11578/g.35840  ORF Transcript_11578/g.35840 Transcript_11578/m.35840 type:complete len:333 (+) Transcript_11578:964-1962(+)
MRFTFESTDTAAHVLCWVVLSLRASFRLSFVKCSLNADTLGFGSTSTIPIRHMGSNASSWLRMALMSRGENARTIPVIVKRFSGSCLPGTVRTAWWHERAVMSSDMSASSTHSFSRTPGSSAPCKWISAMKATSGSDEVPRVGSVGRMLTDISSWLVRIRTASAELLGSHSMSMTVTKSSPTLYIFASRTLHWIPLSCRESWATNPIRSRPVADTSMCDLDGSYAYAGLVATRQSNNSERARPWFPLTSSDTSGTSSAGTSSLPRMYERIQVQNREVVATHGMRRCIGMKAKLMMVDGTHSFHSATRSSLLFLAYFLRPSKICPPLTTSLSE